MSSLDDLFGHDPEPVGYKDYIVIVDLSNLLHSTYHTQVRFDKTLKNGNDKYAMWRYLLLNSILNLKNKLQPEEIVLAIDSSSWRKTYFKYYKANRVLARAKQKDFDYKEFIEVSNGFIDEIAEIMPYKVVKVEQAEADDIIAVLATLLGNKHVTVVSRDKDFKQLLRNKNVSLYDPIDKKYKTIDCAYAYLMEHILRGDSGDGIPNMLSDDNVFVDSTKRQSKITKKVVAAVEEMGLEKYAVEHNLMDNYERNKKLVELSKDEIPEDIWTEVVFQYNQQNPKGDYMKIIQFLRKHKIRALTEKAGAFLF
jgi:UDP-N-acetylglucosamine transferase subunit ALG13